MRLSPRAAGRAAATVLSRVLVGLLVVLIVTGAGGCSFFVGSTQNVTLEASDPSARLFVDGREVGTGTITIPLKRNDSYAVRAELPDGRIARGRIRRNISTVGVVDIVGGIVFLFPFLGAAAPGFWSLEPDYVFLNLNPDPAP